MKLESISKKAVFLSPKVYGLQHLDNTRTIKVKGLSRTSTVNLEIKDLSNLLKLNNRLILVYSLWGSL